MSANEKQVGGSHYATGGATQHWDWVTQNRIPYLEAVATKYVCRWKKKNGKEDLKKAEHYVVKLIEQFDAGICGQRDLAGIGSQPLSLQKFSAANGLGIEEAAFCQLMIGWRNRNDLQKALNIVNRLIEQA